MKISFSHQKNINHKLNNHISHNRIKTILFTLPNVNKLFSKMTQQANKKIE